MALKIGFIGIIADAIAAEPEQTMKWVGGLGFDGMEGAAVLAERFGIPVDKVSGKLAEFGLEAAVQGNISLGMGDDEIREVARRAKTVGSRYAVQYFAPFTSRAEILQHCDFFNRAGRICKDVGVQFLYHNHDHEFKKHDGKYGLEIMLENSDPGLVKVELDSAWTTFGGADPVAIIDRHAARIPVLHMKDFAHLHPGSPTAEGVRKEAVFAEVGDGVVDQKGIVEAARRGGIEWLVIEQDRMNKLDPKASLERSFRNLKALV